MDIETFPAINQGGVFGVPGTMLPEDSDQRTKRLVEFSGGIWQEFGFGRQYRHEKRRQ